MADIYLCITVGGTVHFAQPDALKVGKKWDAPIIISLAIFLNFSPALSPHPLPLPSPSLITLTISPHPHHLSLPSPFLPYLYSLQGSLGNTLKEAQPTIFFGVPRVYEKIMESMQAKLAETKGIKKKIIKWGAKKGIKGNYRRQTRFVNNHMTYIPTVSDLLW